jgi:hypothetical protein
MTLQDAEQVKQFWCSLPPPSRESQIMYYSSMLTNWVLSPPIVHRLAIAKLFIELLADLDKLALLFHLYRYSSLHLLLCALTPLLACLQRP